MRLIICLVILVSCAGNKGDKPVPSREFTIVNDSTDYLNRAVAFIKDVDAVDSKDQPFILTSKPFQFEDFECLDELLKDSTDISKGEMNMIKNDIKKSFIKTWTSDLLPGVKIVSGKTIDSIFNITGGDGWQTFHKRYGGSFHSFSAPYFFRNNQYCLFYEDRSCGWLCGGGDLVLYKKVHGRWVDIKTYCNWIS